MGACGKGSLAEDDVGLSDKKGVFFLQGRKRRGFSVLILMRYLRFRRTMEVSSELTGLMIKFVSRLL